MASSNGYWCGQKFILELIKLSIFKIWLSSYLARIGWKWWILAIKWGSLRSERGHILGMLGSLFWELGRKRGKLSWKRWILKRKLGNLYQSEEYQEDCINPIRLYVGYSNYELSRENVIQGNCIYYFDDFNYQVCQFDLESFW